MKTDSRDTIKHELNMCGCNPQYFITTYIKPFTWSGDETEP